MEPSPSKRRALGSLDPNASSPKPQLGFKQLKPVALNAPGSPLKRSAEPTSEPEPKKRQLTMEPKSEHQPSRKPSVDEKGQQSPRPSDRHRSASPAASSLFDSSGLDNTQGTAITEPDVDAAVPATAGHQQASYGGQSRPPTRPRLTREETREKAEILRLRLGLANYKVRTGQTDVPLELLQMRPLPGITTTTTAAATTKATGIPKIAPDAAASNDALRPATRRPLPGAPVRRRSEDVEVMSDSAGPSSQESGSSQDDEAVPQSRGGPVAGAAASRSTPLNRSPERLGLPRLPAQQQQSAVHTPRRRHLEEADAERLTSSALRGGAANGLLSLARG